MRKFTKFLYRLWSIFFGICTFMVLPVLAVIFIPICAFIKSTWLEMMSMALITGWLCIRYSAFDPNWEEQDGK